MCILKRSLVTYHDFDRRTVAEIQRKVIKKSGRNVVSRLLHAKNDKETIAAWKLDLNRMLHVFNVRLTVSVWLSLTVHSQTELVVNTHVTVSDIRHGVENTHTLVSDIHRNILRAQEGTGGRNQLVGDTCALFIVGKKCSPLPRLKLGQQS